MKKSGIKTKKIIASGIAMAGIALAAAFILRLLVLAVTTDAMNVDWDDWIRNRDYADSWTLSSHVETDMRSVMRYISLKQRLEEADGTLNLDRMALVAQNEDGSISRYSMRDLIRLGEDYGIYVYDGLSDWSNEYYYQSYYERSGESPIRVLWSIMDDEDVAAGVDEDVWAIREARIEKIVSQAEKNSTGEIFPILPDEEELQQMTTDDLLALARRIPTEYPDAIAIPENMIEEWETQMEDLRRSVQNDDMGEEPVTYAAAEPEPVTEPTTAVPDDDRENGAEEYRTDSTSAEISANPEEYWINEWGLYLLPGEEEIRGQIIETLNASRGLQVENAEYLYHHTYAFLLSYLQEYYIYKNILDGEQSNLHYQITLEKNGVKKVYSDPDTAANQTFQPQNSCNVYYTYDSATRRVDSTLQGWSWDSFISLLKNCSLLDCDKETLAVGLDTLSPVYGDAYREEAESYASYRSQVFSAVGVIACSAAAVLAAMIWLMFLSGHKDGVEGIVLNGYDRIPLEPAAIGILCLGGAFIFMCWLTVMVLEGYSSYAADVIALLLIGCGAALVLLAYLMLWLGFYGIVRRVKAHTFWKNSLVWRFVCWCMRPIRWCGRQIKQGWSLLWNTGDATWKTLAAFCVFLLIDFVWCMNLPYAGMLSWLLFLVFNGAVGLFLVWRVNQLKQVQAGVKKIADGDLDYQLPLQDLNGEAKKLAEQINRISEGLKSAIEDSVKNERMKTDLITNVSHDIKTPLTSIINYVDLLKRENIQDPRIQGYIAVLDQKSQRLKTLTEDLVEASKASSGTLKLNLEKIDFVELINQTNGEFIDRFAACRLTVVPSIPEGPAFIMADGRYVWRILENLYRNAEKYAMPGTRVYIDVFEKFGRIFFVMKNISQAPLNIKADELTERFIRGDVSRSTEGSGLGLSIAKDMTELMNGTFKIYLDGDLFRVTISFAVITEKKPDLKEMEESIRRKAAQERTRAGSMSANAETADGMTEESIPQEDMSGKDITQNVTGDIPEETGPQDDCIRISLPRLRLSGKRKKKREKTEDGQGLS